MFWSVCLHRKSAGWVQRVAFLVVLVLCVLVCAGPIVSFEGVLSCHTLPMVPTVRWGVAACDRRFWHGWLARRLKFI